jgi:DNA-binding CsgD family transcriptional regulator/tetratricopeptide (TPR) repeat protein
MHDNHRVILGRDAELAVLSAAADAAEAGNGALVLVEGPAGIGKTTLLRMACARSPLPGPQILTARGLALESGFSYGIARQLIEPVRASAGPGEWDELLDGAAGLAARVFDWAGAGSVEDDVPYATTHGLYWLTANLAARRPLVIAVDDAHWADAPSLRWLAHLAARIDGLPVALLLAVRSGPGEPDALGELRACPACTPLPLRPLGSEATAALVRERLGGQADAELCRACHDRTGGNPFLLEALTAELRAPGSGDPLARVEDLAPEPVVRAVLRRVNQLGERAGQLTQALAILGGPAPVRHAAALAGQDIPDAARLADGLRAADVLAPGSVLEFAHPIVRTAVYESIPPGERALAHANAADLLQRDGADAERIALHLLRSEPGGDPQVVALLRAAAGVASGRGAPGPSAGYLRRALDEPPDPADRPALLLELGLALAAERSPAAPAALTEAVELTTAPPEHATAALLSARLLGIWGHHDSAAVICRDALARPGDPGPAADSLEAELFANAMINAAAIGEARERARSRLASPGPASAWRVNGALVAAAAAQPPGDALDLLAPLLASGLRDVPPDSLAAVYALLALIWSGELTTASDICDTVLRAARGRGSMSMVAHASCLRSMIMRRLGRFDDAAADARLALDFKLATSPPLAVAWAAALGIDALTCLGRFDEADAVAAAAAGREPPAGWIHTLTFLQARGALRIAQRRPAEALDDLLAAGEGWRALGIDNPAAASWRTAAAAAHAALGRPREATALAAEQLALARKVGTPATLGIALRAYAAAAGLERSGRSPATEPPATQIPGTQLPGTQLPGTQLPGTDPPATEPPGTELPAAAPSAGESLSEAVGLLETTPARYELALALADLGVHLHRSGRRTEARAPLRRALDLAERTGAAPLAELARRELLAAGARPRRTALTGPDALTSAERRVAGLAADGLSNRQIAQHLFITQPTVETHLRHAFQKLGISSRADLPAQLAGELPAPAGLPG